MKKTSLETGRGALSALLILWSGALLIFAVMIFFWASINNTGPKLPADRSVYVDQLLLTSNDLNLPARTSLINTLRKDIGIEEGPPSFRSAEDRNKVYNRLLEQRVKKATSASSGDGWRVGALP